MATGQTAWSGPDPFGSAPFDDRSKAGVLGGLYGSSRSKRTGGFLSGSAAANRSAVQRQRTRVKEEPIYLRSDNATFETSGPSRAKVPDDASPDGFMIGSVFSSGPRSTAPFTSDPTAGEQQPNAQSAVVPADYIAEKIEARALAVVQTLRFGPKKVDPPADDPKFAKIEPNSDTRLSSRRTPNDVVEAFLDSRTFVPISKLYSVCLPRPSQDGDFTVPIEGEWVTMAVLTGMTEVRKTIGRRYDYNGNEIDERKFDHLYSAYRNQKGTDPDDIKDEDNPYRMVNRELPSRSFRVATLTDLGQPLDRSETSGDSIVQMLLLQADESYIGIEGKRKYKGGSAGMFEMFEDLTLGTLVCLLNPIVRKSKEKKEKVRNENASVDVMLGNGLDDKMLSLSARSRDCAVVIGMAADYGTCSAMRKDGTICGGFIDHRSRLHACAYHLERGTLTLLKGRQEFANGTTRFPGVSNKGKGKSNYEGGWKRGKQSKPYVEFKTYEEMACSQSKAFVSSNKAAADQHNKADPSNPFFRVGEQLGRDQEARRLRNDQTQRAEDDRVRATLSVRSREKRMTPAAAMRVQGPRGASSGVAGRSTPARAVASAASTPYAANGHGAKAVQEALKKINASSEAAYADSGFRPAERTFVAPNERKRAAVAAQHAQDGDADRTPRRRAIFDPFTGKMRQERDSGRTTDASAKLLARHNATATSLPKPIMSMKHRKGVSSVRPPPGQYFHSLDDSDEELDAALGAWNESEIMAASAPVDDENSDLEIVD